MPGSSFTFSSKQNIGKYTVTATAATTTTATTRSLHVFCCRTAVGWRWCGGGGGDDGGVDGGDDGGGDVSTRYCHLVLLRYKSRRLLMILFVI